MVTVISIIYLIANGFSIVLRIHNRQQQDYLPLAEYKWQNDSHSTAQEWALVWAQEQPA